MKKILFLILFSIVCIKSNAQLDVSMIGVHSSGDILMFDQVTPDAKTIGYSLGKKQSTAYTGHGAKLRRASDNTELIVDYVNNIFDRASAKSFCASTTCFCHILYDNSGNGNNAVQDTATKQAQYVDSDFFNYPSLVFSSGTSQYYWLTTPITLTSGFSWQACMKKTSGNILGFLGTYNTTNSYLMSYTTDNVYTSEPNRQRLSSGLGGMGKGSILVTYATGGSFFQNNTSVANSDGGAITASDVFTIFGKAFNTNGNGSIAAFSVWGSALSGANQTIVRVFYINNWVIH